MSLGACDCCGSPPCPSPEIEFISVSADCDATFCSYYDSETEGYFRIKTIYNDDWKKRDTEITVNATGDGCDETETCSGTLTVVSTTSVSPGPGSEEGEDTSGSTVITDVTTALEDCSECIASSGSSSYSGSAGSRSSTLTDNGDCTGATWSSGGEALMDLYVSSGSYWLYGLEATTTVTRTPAAGSSPGTTYSSQILESDCELEFPEWPAFLSDDPAELIEDQGRSNTSTRAWTHDGLTKAETKIKYRLRHLPTGTCYLKVWISTIFTPLAGTPESPVITSYTWSGTGNPCLTVATDPANADSQKINGSTTEVLPPATDGSKVVTILKWSCVDGYEPDVSDPDNKQPNGYPNPEWEASPP